MGGGLYIRSCRAKAVSLSDPPKGLFGSVMSLEREFEDGDGLDAMEMVSLLAIESMSQNGMFAMFTFEEEMSIWSSSIFTIFFSMNLGKKLIEFFNLIWNLLMGFHHFFLKNSVFFFFEK